MRRVVDRVHGLVLSVFERLDLLFGEFDHGFLLLLSLSYAKPEGACKSAGYRLVSGSAAL
jgi:hypothetical protein